MRSSRGCWAALVPDPLDIVAGGGGRVVDLCMCINERVGLLFMWFYNRDKGILGLDSGLRRVWEGVGSRLTPEGGDVRPRPIGGGG